MAEIFAFPEDGRTATMPDCAVASSSRPHDVPDNVWHAVESVRAMKRIPGVQYREMSVPLDDADYGIGVSLVCNGADSAHVYGWITILRERATQRHRHTQWRCVAFARIPLHPVEDNDSAPNMIWDDVLATLSNVAVNGSNTIANKGSDIAGPRGTVTITHDVAFGISAPDVAAGCEIRVSWTPLEHAGVLDAGKQVNAWAQFVASAVQREEAFH
ncbi:DUF3000 family protein [Bifidobacterium hapali]|nr:DUF3000 family protein [Bifidobacterium hapali]